MYITIFVYLFDWNITMQHRFWNYPIPRKKTTVVVGFKTISFNFHKPPQINNPGIVLNCAIKILVLKGVILILDTV